jgi:hypothetical protein
MGQHQNATSSIGKALEHDPSIAPSEAGATS